MSDGIIDLTQYISRAPEQEDPQRGAFALWGADGEPSRFALPIWRTIYLAEGERGFLVWRDPDDDGGPHPFVVLDLGSDPARLDIEMAAVPIAEDGEPPVLHDLESAGLAVHLGTREGRVWHLVVDGGGRRQSRLNARSREEVLFLAGECAGLLFLRDFADEVE
ncbi:MAG: hypothetical protein HOD00_11165 [Gemmatimonadales bacterium]|jgi:hypothetical protein|nr:hypothetical protein [Gemmatimonadales bacterium]NCG32782.1 hypothetical protein [Pseudomonadota bacterium]MBT3775436.1 hypothetical protein [Gemmatimonadales bacterium]MBT3958635.1 hypothetical protein [Gemmatimonadales bacterium]MBT4187457.1 hypothetical protein [Gemmatimonadales bacterium]